MESKNKQSSSGSAQHSMLGKSVAYSDQYDPGLLFSIPRKEKRDEISIPTGALPFQGFDLWMGYELSWLNAKGKPMVSLLKVKVPASSEFLIESKSFKLYLNSFNQTQVENQTQLEAMLQKDLSRAAGVSVEVNLSPARFLWGQRSDFDFEKRTIGTLIDDIDVAINEYTYNPGLLAIAENEVSEVLVSHLLKSNCLITGQPDWGSLMIKYQGPQIKVDSLLKYIVSFRNHNEFHEQCVERIFVDLKKYCRCSKLSVMARYTRRGGLDINPFRSDFENEMLDFGRTIRQ